MVAPIFTFFCLFRFHYRCLVQSCSFPLSFSYSIFTFNCGTWYEVHISIFMLIAMLIFIYIYSVSLPGIKYLVHLGIYLYFQLSLSGLFSFFSFIAYFRHNFQFQHHDSFSCSRVATPQRSFECSHFPKCFTLLSVRPALLPASLRRSALQRTSLASLARSHTL